MAQDFTTMKPTAVMMYSLVGYERDGVFIPGSATVNAMAAIEDAVSMKNVTTAMELMNKKCIGDDTQKAPTKDSIDPGDPYVSQWMIIAKLKEIQDRIKAGQDKEYNQSLLQYFTTAGNSLNTQMNVCQAPLQNTQKGLDNQI